MQTERDASQHTSSTADTIQDVLSSIRNLPAGDDLRLWTPKARRALRSAGNIYCIVDQDEKSPEIFIVPKLALFVASPVLRDSIAFEPDLQEIHFADVGFTPAAIGILCYWLNSICNWSSQAVPRLPCPRDVFVALELRYAAYLLCMDQYVQSIDLWYCRGVWHRFPCLEEGITMGTYTLGVDDLVLNAWASRVAYLLHTEQLSWQYIERLNDELFESEKGKLFHALVRAEAIFHDE
ncbi:hypothetical protein CC86DRAFT_419994 [Ophiobolus disseminans]|uniref:BTB domain-containing protein n=1 Tax=Ophiobolus disseminans TaxID=1469910 RepID=A0A6A6ZWN1_9PLEO|nr:hypothetical protein CC86DRAFT_419994 [Ophiobolus disseminans]